MNIEIKGKTVDTSLFMKIIGRTKMRLPILLVLWSRMTPLLVQTTSQPAREIMGAANSRVSPLVALFLAFHNSIGPVDCRRARMIRMTSDYKMILIEVNFFIEITQNIKMKSVELEHGLKYGNVYLIIKLLHKSIKK